MIRFCFIFHYKFCLIIYKFTFAMYEAQRYPSHPPLLKLKSYQPLINLPPQVLYSKEKLENINCIEGPTSTMGGLYLGDIISVMKAELFKEHNIQAILTCSIENQKLPSHCGQVPRKLISIKDNLEYPINAHFEEANAFIESMRQSRRNVLIHCHAGVSRSATLVCAYLMKKNSWDSNSSLEYVKKKRPRIRPNQNFLRLLQQYEKQLSQPMTQSFLLQQKPSILNESVIISPASIHLTHNKQSSTLSGSGKESPLRGQSIKNQLTTDRSVIGIESISCKKRSLKLASREKKSRIPWQLLNEVHERRVNRKLFADTTEVKESGCCF